MLLCNKQDGNYEQTAKQTTGRQRTGNGPDAPMVSILFCRHVRLGLLCAPLISTESAARVGAEYASQSSAQASNQATACILANEELRIMSNVSGTGTPTCAASPVIVTAAQVGQGHATNSADNQQASQVTVQYTTVGLIPIPGLLKSSTTLYRVVQMRLRS